MEITHVTGKATFWYQADGSPTLEVENLSTDGALFFQQWMKDYAKAIRDGELREVTHVHNGGFREVPVEG